MIRDNLKGLIGNIRKAKEEKRPWVDTLMFISKFRGIISLALMLLLFIFFVNKIDIMTDNIGDRMNQIDDKVNRLILKINKRGLDVQGVKNIILKYCDHISVDTAYIYAEEIVSLANTYEVLTPSLLTAQIYQESKFFKDTVSKAGAEGLMQIMPETQAMICAEWSMTCTDKTAFNPIINMRMGAWYMDWLIKRIKLIENNRNGALAYYNGGGRQAFRYMLLEKSLKGVELDSLETHYMEALATETKNYVSKINRRDSLFHRIIADQLPTG